MVLEPGPQRTLASVLGSPMDIRSFLSIAIAIAIAIGISAALAELHRHELVHKDLKPEHMLLDADGRVRLTGLVIASHLPRERQAPETPEVLAGTLAYMAPIVRLVPEVEFIIGKQPPAPDLRPQKARNRFQMTLLRFLGVFAGPEHPSRPLPRRSPVAGCRHARSH